MTRTCAVGPHASATSHCFFNDQRLHQPGPNLNWRLRILCTSSKPARPLIGRDTPRQYSTQLLLADFVDEPGRFAGPAYQRRQATRLIDARAIRRHRLQTVDTRVYSLCTLLTDRSGRIHPGSKGPARWRGPTPVGPQRLATYMVISMPKRRSVAFGVSHFISNLLSYRK